jgi:DNA-3-methyladenine glycosylase II
MPDTLDAARLEAARRTLARRDPRLGRAIRRIGPCTLRANGDPYRSLLRSVLHQQLAGAAARAIEGRLKARYRGRYPAPAVLAAASPDELRAVGLSRQKTATLQAIAAAFAEGRLETRRLRRMSDDEITAAVTQIRGIGEWTAHMLLMSCFASPDVLPVGDYGVRKGAQQLYGLSELPKRAQLEALAEPWRPFRSVGAWYLWRVLDET